MIKELEKQIIQIAEKFYKNPDEFIDILEKLFENVPYNEKGDDFSYVGRTLYDFSYFNLATRSWKHALKYAIKNDDKYGESALLYISRHRLPEPR